MKTSAGSKKSVTVNRCRACGTSGLYSYLDLGKPPLANSYLNKADLALKEFTEELRLQLCSRCGLSQLTKVVHPDRMFRHYLYVSSTSATMRKHFGELALSAVTVAGAVPGDLAIDIASNDGCLLNAFEKLGLKIRGVDPAKNLAKEANARGLKTLNAYWSLATAKTLVAESGKAKVITATNVFAHAHDLKGFIAGVRFALAPAGVFIVECPYLPDFIKRCEFDTSYHEHLSYFGATPLKTLMERNGMAVFDIERFADIHGGTIRVYCSLKGARKPRPTVSEYLAREKKFGIRERRRYDGFARRIQANRKALIGLVDGLVRGKKKIWAYGAGAKGNTLVNFFGLDSDSIPAVIDDNPKKWGLYTPGGRMRVVSVNALKKEKVDVLLLLAWNFEKEIRMRCRAAGFTGRFLIPVPEARLLAS